MTTVAAVDIGTNSCRLLIAEGGPDGLRPLDRRLVITRLGQGVDATGRLAPEAIDRVVDAVAGYAAAWRAVGVDRAGIIATSAARDAADGDELVRRLIDVSGVLPRVLTGGEEARMSFMGATAGRPDDAGVVAVIDIGGGSTEVIVGRDRPEAATSRDIGSVRLTERILTDDPATPAQVAAARAVVDVELAAIVREVDPARADVLVAVAGTATTLAGIHAGLEAWVDGAVHGRWLSAADLSALAQRLLATSAADIARLGPVQPGREDVLAAGALILDMVVQHVGVDGVRISESDVLDGLAMELLADGGVADGGVAGG